MSRRGFGVREDDGKGMCLEDIATSIDSMVSDDEILTKLVLKYLTEFRQELLPGKSPNEKFFNKDSLFHTFWPYPAFPPDTQGVVVETGKPVVGRPAFEMSELEEEYLSAIQKGLGRKVRGVELTSFCEDLATACEVRLLKKDKISKGRLLTWMVENRGKLDEHFMEVVTAFAAKHRD